VLTKRAIVNCQDLVDSHALECWMPSPVSGGIATAEQIQLLPPLNGGKCAVACGSNSADAWRGHVFIQDGLATSVATGVPTESRIR
jgi:hypothetical protein